ncbi:MAG TPA: murein L,D-transpeptidase catalytic domain family protein [Allosphingosinicella sp.]
MIKAGAAAGLLSAAGPLFAAPRRTSPIDGDLLDRALQAMERNRTILGRTDVIAIVDYSRPSREERLFLVDMESGVVTGHHVAHGRGSDPAHTGYLEHFSNAPGSAASSAGAYVTGDLYHGRYGRAMRLKGVSETNSNAQSRGIVVHSAPYAEPEVIDRMGKLGRSEGCFALSELSLFLVLRQLGPGRLLYSGRS